MVRALKYTGILTVDEYIHPTSTGTTWYPHRPKHASEIQRVILHFHGGAYVIGNGRDNDTAFLAHTLLNACGRSVSHVLCPQYRLASGHNCRFPAALQDAVSCYAYLIDVLGLKSGQIVVSGDSAGANLACALLRYLEQHSGELDLQPPSHVWLWSPWTDAISALHNPSSHDRSPFARTDYTTGAFGLWGAKLFKPAPWTGIDLACEYIQIKGNPFKTNARVFICVGGLEIFANDSLLVAKEMGAKGDNVVESFVIENAPHDVLLVGDKIAFGRAAREGAEAAALSLGLGSS